MLADYLKTRVARRLYGLFVVVALAPVLLLGAYAYFQVTGHLIESSLERARDESKNIGMDVLGRLNVLSEELSSIAVLVEGGANIAALRSRSFDALRMTTVKELDLPAIQLAHLASSGVVLRSDHLSSYRLLAPLSDRTRVLEGVLSRDSPWPETVRGLPFCIFDGSGEPLHCSPEVASIELELPMRFEQHSGTSRLLAGGERYLAGHWTIPLEPMYAHEHMTVVGLSPERTALAAVGHFQRVFPAVLGLAVALAIWLAMGQIRRQLRPLEALVGAAARLGDGDFEARVSTRNKDEFSDLAQVFNRMVSALKRKFHLLEALSTLDRMVLSNAEMADVVRSAIEHTPAATACDNVGVIVPVPRANGTLATASLHYRLASHDQVITRAGISLDSEAQKLLNSRESWTECPAEALECEWVDVFVREGLRCIWLLPAVVDGRLAAVLLLAFADSPAELGDSLQAGRGIADRLAAASSNLALEEALYRKMHYDALTGLPNLVLLRDRVEQSIANAERDQRSLALLLLDLDRFRDINDSLGHATGDAILIGMAERLTDSVRKVDTVTRVGGDEFLVLLSDLDPGTESTTVSRLAEQLLAAVSEPFELHGRNINVGTSIGISLYPANSGGFEDLLKGAESAMYEAKRLSPGSYRFHSIEIELRARQRFERIQQLQRAFELDEFLLHFQPKVEASSGRIVGAEALVRWQPGGAELIPPGAFLPLIEELGLTTKLGNWVMETACRQLAEWDRLGFSLPSVSVNVSPIQFAESDLPALVQSALDGCGLAADRLEIEILEETAVAQTGKARESLETLLERGLNIALDDFGTGYSSLSYLVNIPANVIKLDRSFLKPLTSDARQAGVISAIISLAKSLDMQVVAEGVEDGEHWAALERMGCDLIQGYLFSPPVGPEDFTNLLRQQGPLL